MWQDFSSFSEWFLQDLRCQLFQIKMLSRKHIPETEAVGSNFANFGYALDRCNANFNVHDARGHPTILAEATWLLCGGRTAPKVPAREVLPLRDVQLSVRGGVRAHSVRVSVYSKLSSVGLCRSPGDLQRPQPDVHE